MFKVYLIPVLKDNYIFLLNDSKNKIAAVVDPAVSDPVLKLLDELDSKLVAIFNTHHHEDHIGANLTLLSVFPNLTVYGGALDVNRIPAQHVFLTEDDTVEFASKRGQIIHVPGHIIGHIAYYFPPNLGENYGDLFCGDTLFSGGCGRIFEGTSTQMLHSLNKLNQLPGNTHIWCAHEYTLNNLEFALSILPDDENIIKELDRIKELRKQNIPTIPSLLERERIINIFLRCNEIELQNATGILRPEKLFSELRSRKNNY